MMDHMILVCFIGAILVGIGGVIAFISDMPIIQKFTSKLTNMFAGEE